jgi:tetratricopeptide (TPR) repeat protein
MKYIILFWVLIFSMVQDYFFDSPEQSIYLWEPNQTQISKNIFPANKKQKQEAKLLAKQAYHQIEGNVFNATELNQAVEKLTQAKEINDQEPWVWLGASLYLNVTGYKVGGWYDIRNFSRPHIERALEFAKTAVRLGPNEIHTHSHMARILILIDHSDQAEAEIDRAFKISKENFYPWYFHGILNKKKRRVAEAHSQFNEAEKWIQNPFHKRLLHTHREDLYELTGNLAKRESLLKKLIAAAPTEPQPHGNYACFLMENGRVDESVYQWEKAVELGPYPIATEQLKEAYEIKNGTRPLKKKYC